MITVFSVGVCLFFLVGDMEEQRRHAPVIFLDIDGVLNRTRSATHIRVDDDLVARLRQLLADTGAVIVLSTFWRHFQEYIAYVLHRHGVPAGVVIGRTSGKSDASRLSADAGDTSNYANRAAEIRNWLAAHPTVTRFVIIDDRSSASDEGLAPRFVQTDAAVGLTDAAAARCAALLTRDIGADLGSVD